MPTTVVTRGEFVEVVELRGDIRPVRSVVLGAPTQSGDLQIVRLVKNGTPVKAGDIVIEFDATSLERQQTDRRAELKQAQAETEQAEAQAHIAEEASATNLMRARFDVNRARLDVVDRDFVARIEYERAKLALSDAEQRLKEAEKRQVADVASARTDVLRRQRRQQRIQEDLDRIDAAIESLVVRAPSDGTASLMANPRSGGGGPGQSRNSQDFREGDRAWPGAADRRTARPVLGAPDGAARRSRPRARGGRTRRRPCTSTRCRTVPITRRCSKISLLARVDFATAWPPARDFDLELEHGRPGRAAEAGHDGDGAHRRGPAPEHAHRAGQGRHAGQRAAHGVRAARLGAHAAAHRHRPARARPDRREVGRRGGRPDCDREPGGARPEARK